MSLNFPYFRDVRSLRWLFCGAAAGALAWTLGAPHGPAISFSTASAQEFDDDFDDDVDEEMEEDIEDEIEEELEQEIEDEFEDDFEDEFEEEFEEDFDDEFDEDFEDDVDDEFEEGFDEDIDHDAEDDFEDEPDEEFEDDGYVEPDDDGSDGDHDDTFEDGSEDEDGDAETGEDGEFYDPASEDGERDDEELKGDEADADEDEPYDDVIFELDDLIQEGDEEALDEFIVLVPIDALEDLRGEGLIAEEIERLDELDLVVAEVLAPGSTNTDEIEATIASIVPDAAVDRNHLYSPGTPDGLEVNMGYAPASLMHLEPFGDDHMVSVGIIDTALDPSHPAFEDGRLVTRDFVPFIAPRPLDHGTAVASIIGGQSPEYQGLLPNAHLHCASVFFETPTTGVKATTTSLVQALEWMNESNVAVVNMSLTGPPNRILEQVIQSYSEDGMTIIAAAGNNGPAAPPLYPAAYESVVAVTAVSHDNQVYRLANRGAHIDFAAPGIDILHAVPGTEYSASTGTSIATPFVAATIALHKDKENLPGLATLSALAAAAQDLGDPGRDDVYGFGRIKWPDLILEADAQP